MSSDAPKSTPIGDALSKPPEIPQDAIQIGGVARDGDVAIAGRGHVDLGKPGGWWTSATAEYWKTKGYELALWVGWSKDKT
jgi:hypothetical protein